jgi:hypothetical protein
MVQTFHNGSLNQNNETCGAKACVLRDMDTVDFCGKFWLQYKFS